MRVRLLLPCMHVPSTHCPTHLHLRLLMVLISPVHLLASPTVSAKKKKVRPPEVCDSVCTANFVPAPPLSA